jgi:hypothetical protein
MSTPASNGGPSLSPPGHRPRTASWALFFDLLARLGRHLLLCTPPHVPVGASRGDAAQVRPISGVARESVGGESKATTTPTAEASMTTTPRTPCREPIRRNVRLETCAANPNDLAGTTLRWLGSERPELGSERAAIVLFAACMKNQPPAAMLFANPIARVTAPRTCDAFFVEARRQQRRWFTQLNDWLYSADRVKRHYAKAHPIVRELEFLGVMIADGKHIRPNQWPSIPTRSASESLAGRVFGHLTVTADLPGQQCRCLCRCGNRVCKRRKHLIAGRTKSCGCLAAAKARTIEERKTETRQCSRR